jgi:subtilisin family serine protease
MVVPRRLRRSFAAFAALALLVTTLGPAAAEDDAVPELGSATTVERGEWNSYIVVMKADPLVVTEGQNLGTNQARNRGQQLKQSHDQALQDAGIDPNKKTTDYVNALNGFSALITYEEALRVASDKNVAFVIPDELMQAHTDASPTFIGLDATGGAWNSGVTGKGVVVGIIDTGIWPEHPSFADNGLPAPPVTIADLPAQSDPPRPALRGCDFGNTTHNPNDAPFTCNNKLIGARQVMPTYRALIGATADEFNSARDDNGHGTHTASTAAGNAGVQAQIFGRNVGDGTISGIAPDAHVVMYKGLGNQGGFGSDLALAIDTAVADGVDVINYSIGGGAAAVTADEIAFLFAADAGVHVAASAGNSGPGPGTIFNPGKAPWLTTVGANTQTRFLAGTVALGSAATFEGASVTLGTNGTFPLVDAATAAPGANGDLCISAATGTSKLDPAVVTGKIVLCRRGTNARVDKSLAVKNAGGVGMILYENDNVSNLFTDNHHVPSVHIDNAPGLAIKAYIASAGALATAEIRNTGANSTWPSAPSMTSFSSRGPNVFPDVLKPDITAPGMQILAGASPFPDPGNVTGQLFQAIAGTSMSSPHVAGLYALLDQAHPDWSAAAAKSALMTTANPNVRDNDRVSQATPFGMGAGHVNPGRVDRRGSSFAPGLVYDAGLLDYLGFLCDAQPSVFEDPDAECDDLAGAGVPTDASDLNYPSISVGELAGSQTVTRTVTSVAEENAPRTYTVSVKAPAGYAVTVSPSTFTLRRGQTATYEVTFVNQSAPIGEWRFGELTWSSPATASTTYNVRSPIAVRAAAFDAPESVSGEGESGSASFDVKFGYTGEYDATSHGLVPATVTVDNVPQDPNQQFSRTDGFSDAHTFDLNNVEVFRVALPPESVTVEGVDLDVYVYNPAGQQVASSGAPDTDEEVTINRPVNGTWTVYIHGWQTVNPTADYTMWSWIISGAPGGNLVIESEPADAVIATTGTIDVSWTGATAGQWHLGAVRHNGPGGSHLGRTLVEVDNR